MMGMLKGTLTKFKDDSTQEAKSSAVQRRNEIEHRLREKLTKERAELEASRRQKLDSLKHEAELRFRIAENKRQLNYSGYLATITEPRVYFLPSVLTPEQESTIQQQRDKVNSKSHSEKDVPMETETETEMETTPTIETTPVKAIPSEPHPDTSIEVIAALAPADDTEDAVEY